MGGCFKWHLRFLNSSAHHVTCTWTQPCGTVHMGALREISMMQSVYSESKTLREKTVHKKLIGGLDRKK